MDRNDSQPPAPVSAIVTAYKRIPQTLKTLDVIARSSPRPAEILVHVDGDQRECADAIKSAFPGVQVLLSAANIGPGGGRNRLMAAASSPFIASFDDDSYPAQADFFARIVATFERYPAASVLAARIVNRGEPTPAESTRDLWGANFVGCGCVYRKSALAGIEGYVPLPVAYGMEEVDLSLQLIDGGGAILQTSSIMVHHDTDFAHHKDPKITAYSLANVALLAFLRYPPLYWPLGVLQVLNRARWLMAAGRVRGILAGLWLTPGYLYARRRLRRPVSLAGFRRFRRLRSVPVPAQPGVMPA